MSGLEEISVRWLGEQFAQRYGKTPQLTGKELENSWLIDSTESQRIFGPSRVSLNTMIDWVADWVARGQPSLGEKTHFETRDGNY